MATFDGWEAQLYGPNTLAHFRTKGSKNGVRRFQNEDGTWTPLGLRERKEREGWGDKETRRAAKREAKAERKAQRAARIEAYREQKRKSDPKNMTDAELRAAIERKKMETEYKELNRSPFLKAGEKLVSGYMNYRIKKSEAENARQKMALEFKRIETERVKALEETKQAKAEANKAKSELKKAKTRSARDQASANKTNQETQAKRFVADNTIRGGLKKRINALLSSGYAEKKAEMRYVSAQKKGSKLIKKANDKRDVWESLDYTAPSREEFFKNKKQQNNNNNEENKKKKNKG